MTRLSNNAVLDRLEDKQVLQKTPEEIACAKNEECTALGDNVLGSFKELSAKVSSPLSAVDLTAAALQPTAEDLPFEPTLVAGPAMIDTIIPSKLANDFIDKSGGKPEECSIEFSNNLELPRAVKDIVGLNRKINAVLVRITPNTRLATDLVKGGEYHANGKVLIVAGNKAFQKIALNQEAFHAYVHQWFPAIHNRVYDKDFFSKNDVFKDLKPAYPYSGNELEEFFSEIVTLSSNKEFGFSRLTNLKIGDRSSAYRLIGDFAKSIEGKGYTSDTLANILVPFAKSYFQD